EVVAGLREQRFEPREGLALAGGHFPEQVTALTVCRLGLAHGRPPGAGARPAALGCPERTPGFRDGWGVCEFTRMYLFQPTRQGKPGQTPQTFPWLKCLWRREKCREVVGREGLARRVGAVFISRVSLVRSQPPLLTQL